MGTQKRSSSSPSKHPFLEQAGNAVIIRVRLQPRSSRNRIEAVQGDSIKIRLTAPPVEGEANRALIEFLSDITGIRKSAFSIHSGHKSRDKSVSVEGASIDAIEKSFSKELP